MIAKRFKKRPVEVDACRLTTTNYADITRWIRESGGDAYLGAGSISIGIRTLEGEMRADVGDWIIQGVAGEFYPCKDEIFQKTYEPLTAPASDEGDE